MVPLLLDPRAILVPSIVNISALPSRRPLTLKLKDRIVWPASIALTLALLNTVTAAPWLARPWASL